MEHLTTYIPYARRNTHSTVKVKIKQISIFHRLLPIGTGVKQEEINCQQITWLNFAVFGAVRHGGILT
jgi:hypothetical protein